MNLREEMEGFMKFAKRTESVSQIRLEPRDVPDINTVFDDWLKLHPPNQGYDEL